MKIRLTALLCVIALLAAVMAGCGNGSVLDNAISQKDSQSNQKTETAKTFTVHASVPSQWASPAIWAWSEEADAFDAWPGEPLSLDAEGWYVAEVPEWVGYLIVNGNDGSVQTADIPISSKDLWIIVDSDLTYELHYQEVELPDSGAAYDKIIEEYGLKDSASMFIMTKSQTAFIAVDSEGSIHKVVFGHNDDLIKQIEETIYLPMSGISDEDKDAVTAYAQLMVETVESLGFCSAKRQLTDDYCIITITMSDMDNGANIQKAKDAEVLAAVEGANGLSMELTEEKMLNAGYAKRG